MLLHTSRTMDGPCMKLRIVQKIRFSVLESGRTNACCPSLVSRPSAKAQEQVARSRGLIIQPPKLFGVSAECQIIGTIGKKQRAVARSRGLVIQPQKLSVGAYFELLLQGCGFLIHLSNRSDSPRFRALWKQILQKYGTQQEPSLFKVHPLSCQYGEILCSMVPC